MRRISLMLLLLSIALGTIAQLPFGIFDEGYVKGGIATFHPSITGNPVAFQKYSRLSDGNPFLVDEWKDGKVLIKGNNGFLNASVKLDLIASSLYYKDAQGNEMEAIPQINDVIIDFAGVKRHFVHGAAIESSGEIEKAWYEWLVGGQADLFKMNKKVLSENQIYGTSIIEEKVQTIEKLFLYHNRQFNRVKNINEVPALLPDKRRELQEYMKKKGLNSKREVDIIDLIRYYNSLFPKKVT